MQGCALHCNKTFEVSVGGHDHLRWRKPSPTRSRGEGFRYVHGGETRFPTGKPHFATTARTSKYCMTHNKEYTVIPIV